MWNSAKVAMVINPHLGQDFSSSSNSLVSFLSPLEEKNTIFKTMPLRLFSIPDLNLRSVRHNELFSKFLTNYVEPSRNAFFPTISLSNAESFRDGLRVLYEFCWATSGCLSSFFRVKPSWLRIELGIQIILKSEAGSVTCRDLFPFMSSKGSMGSDIEGVP